MNFTAKKILLIVTRQLGDVLLTTPLIHSLRHAYPHAVLNLLVFKGTEEILKGNPDIDNLIPISKHPSFTETAHLLKKIFRQYDLAISTLCGDKPIIYHFLASSRRIAMVPPPRLRNTWKRFISHKWVELDDWDTHTVIQNLRLCDLLGIDRHYQVVSPKSPNSYETINKVIPFSRPKHGYVVFHLVPLRRYKRWTVKGWVRLAQYLKSQNLQVVITGGDGKEEADHVESVLSEMPDGTVNLVGKLTFAEVASLIRSSTLFVGPDTAVTHLAASTGTPTVALYGPTNPVKWAPWPYGYKQDKNPFERKGIQRVGNVLLIQGPGDCVPCHQEGCDGHRHSRSRCLDELEVETVIQGVKKCLPNISG
jgi:heptosyltransferase-3